MRKALTVSLLLLAAIPAVAQLKTPRVSPRSVLTQTIGLTDVTVTYSRPAVKGRQIWGGLVPYDKVWRTGANEATTISFSDDVTIDGQPLPKGTYSLHTIPSAGEWTVIFNSVADQWGSFSYDQAKDALRVKVKPTSGPHAELMTFTFPTVSNDAATLVLRWADLALPIHIGVNTTAKVMAAAREAVAGAKPGDWRTANTAANFAFDNGMLTEAQQWNDASVKAGENMTNLWLRARIMEKRGQKADAIRTGEMALAKKTEKDSSELAAEIRTQLDSWKK